MRKEAKKMTVHLQRLFLPLVYVLVLVLLTYLIFLWRRSIKLEHEKQRLEQIIKESTREMEEKKQQLELQAVRFLSDISHEFRTPLTLIMLPLEHMLENCRDKKTEEGLNLMMENSLKLLTLIYFELMACLLLLYLAIGHYCIIQLMGEKPSPSVEGFSL